MSDGFTAWAHLEAMGTTTAPVSLPARRSFELGDLMDEAERAVVAHYRMCEAKGPRVAHDVPNGWGSSPTCTLIEDHAGPHRYVGQVGGGYTIEWNEPCERAGEGS